MTDTIWDRQLRALRKRVYDSELPSVSQIAADNGNPFHVLISTMISLRTKDEVTTAASQRLLGRADTPRAMADLDEEEIADLIYPAGFYRTKAKHIRESARIIEHNYGGKVPAERDQLLELPGVGVKTANLTLNLGFGIDAICVDTHVHRISNRIGWVSAKSPELTEKELEKVLPRKYWIEINGLLVTYGKRVCTPQSPRCSSCYLSEECPKMGVTRTR